MYPCREYGFRVRDGWKLTEPQLTRLDYEASDGKEIFLSFEDSQETIYALLRLRLQDKPIANLGGPIGNNSALVRELHVFGPELALSQRDSTAAQHRGLGKALLREAERIAHDEFQCGHLAILSGVGAREYYRGEGYNLRGAYMVKQLGV